MTMRIAALCAVLLAACGAENTQGAAPPPAEINDEAIGYYCHMNVIEHAGPKAQIFIKGVDEPLWFSQARDGVVYTRLPEETAKITAFYVTDMGRSADWSVARDFVWIAAADAYFVIDSSRSGGMGAAETVPFGELADAERFRAQYGGRIVSLDKIPDQYVLGPAPDAQINNGDAP